MKKQSTLYYPTLHDMGGWFVAVGEVIDDPRFEDNKCVRTSVVKRIDLENRVIETHNTIYNVVGDIKWPYLPPTSVKE